MSARRLAQLLAAVVGGGAVLLLASTFLAPRTTSQSPSEKGSWGAMVQRGLAQANREAKLDHGHTLAAGFGAAESVPPQIRHQVSRNIDQIRSLRLNFDDAQLVHTGGGVRLWLVGGLGVTCLIDDATVAIACDTATNADRRGIYLATYWLSDLKRALRTKFRVVGVAPSHWRSVPAMLGDRPLSIPVVHRTFEYHADQPIRLRIPA